MRDREPIAAAITRLLDVVVVVIGDQQAVRVAEGDTGGADAATEAADCVAQVRQLVAGPAFTDTVTVLLVLCRRLDWGGGATTPAPEDVLGRVDDLLRLLGVGAQVSVLQLWAQARTDFAGDQAADLWAAVSALLTTVATECRDTPA